MVSGFWPSTSRLEMGRKVSMEARNFSSKALNDCWSPTAPVCEAWQRSRLERVFQIAIETGPDCGGFFAVRPRRRPSDGGFRCVLDQISAASGSSHPPNSDSHTCLNQASCGLSALSTPGAFAPGRCAQTGLARAAVLLAPLGDPDASGSEDGMDLVVCQSFADYLLDWLAAMAGERGLAAAVA
jgi:hypothetical protein